MKWCVTLPEEQVLIVRPSLNAICFGSKPAAKLLAVLLYRQSIRQEHKSDAENINEFKAMQGEKADQDTSYRIFRKQAQLIADMCGEITEKTLHDVAVPTLQVLGYLNIEEHLACNCYILNKEAIQASLKMYSELSPEQLELFLIDHMQLEIFLIDKKYFLSAQKGEDGLEKVLIDKKYFLSQLEKVLIWNRKSSNCHRGRKPASGAPLDGNFEPPKSNKSNSKSNKEDINATSVADPLSFIENLTEEDLALLREKLGEKNSTPQEEVPSPPEIPTPTQASQKETGKGKGHGRNRATHNSEEVAVTLQGQHILDLYGTHKGRKVTPTTETLKAANSLGDTVASDEDFLEVLKEVDNDPFLKEKKVRTDLDFVFRKYDGFLDAVMKDRKKKASGASTIDYNQVAGMTDEERAAYKRQQEEKREKAMPKPIREAMMKLSPEERVDFIRKWKQEHQQAALA